MMNQLSLLDNCSLCGLYHKAKSPKMKYSGKGELEVLLIGEAPGELEDIKGKQFVGPAGQVLRGSLRKLGYDPNRDFYFFNVVSCRPYENHGTHTKNRTPTPQEIMYCETKVDETIFSLQPKLIVFLGNSPLQVFLNKYMSSDNKKTISGVRGIPLISQKYNCWVLLSFHPSYIMRQGDKELEKIFVRDLAKIKSVQNDYEERINIANKFKFYSQEQDIISFLNKILDNQINQIAFDWETTGLSPYIGNDRILSVALSDGQETVSFFIDNEKLKNKLIKVLSKSVIPLRSSRI